MSGYLLRKFKDAPFKDKFAVMGIMLFACVITIPWKLYYTNKRLLKRIRKQQR